jgi:hypothetical protein
LYIGSAPNRVKKISTNVAIGESAPAARKSDAWLITESRKIIDAGQTHNLPPGMLLVGSRGILRGAAAFFALVKPELELAS